MPPLIWDHQPENLRKPAMVCAFEGWNDAGDSASNAVGLFMRTLKARRFAHYDPQEFFDFQANRPLIRHTTEGSRGLTWPTVEIFEGHAPRAARDLVLVRGVEPSMRWRSFCSHLIDLAEALGVEMIITLGALLGDVAHSRPVSMTGYASDLPLIESLGVKASTYEGPTGILGALHVCCLEAEMPSASLWAGVPHYVAAASNPKAALALVRKVELLVNVSVNASELEEAAEDYERQVAAAVQCDPEISAFVERLEQEADSDPQLATRQVPSGDVLEREFQRFLKQRGPRP
ncbi:MAG TPA: PAC2 family protein [Solirubrobacteraceae bacterium]|nr:PAC2 family protein [Solirubrobacteraceae bacterium]